MKNSKGQCREQILRNTDAVVAGSSPVSLPFMEGVAQLEERVALRGSKPVFAFSPLTFIGM